MDRENKCALIHRVDSLNPKFQVSNHLLWLNSPICVRPGLKPADSFSNYAVLYTRICINKHNVLQVSSKFVFVVFNENGNQQYLKYLFHSCFFLCNFFQNFLQYMYFFSAVFGLKVGCEIHFYLCSDYHHNWAAA